MSFIPATSTSSTDTKLTVDFSQEARTRAFASIRNSEAPAKERFEAADYLRKYAATLSSIFDEYSLRNDHYEGMATLSSSIASAIVDAKETLPELETHLARLPAFTIRFEERNSLYDAIIKEQGSCYEESEKSQGKLGVLSDTPPEPDLTSYSETFPDFTWETKTRALTCLQNDNASPKQRLEAATYLAVYEAALFTVLQNETPSPAWPVLSEMHSGIVSALVDAKKSVPGLEAMLNRLASRRWGDAKADRERVYLLKALTDGELFEDGGATLQLELTKGNLRSQTIAVALQVMKNHRRLYTGNSG